MFFKQPAHKRFVDFEKRHCAGSGNRARGVCSRHGSRATLENWQWHHSVQGTAQAPQARQKVKSAQQQTQRHQEQGNYQGNTILVSRLP